MGGESGSEQVAANQDSSPLDSPHPRQALPQGNFIGAPKLPSGPTWNLDRMLIGQLHECSRRCPLAGSYRLPSRVCIFVDMFRYPVSTRSLTLFPSTRSDPPTFQYGSLRSPWLCRVHYHHNPLASRARRSLSACPCLGHPSSPADHGRLWRPFRPTISPIHLDWWLVD
jgi:hypothetical protein